MNENAATPPPVLPPRVRFTPSPRRFGQTDLYHAYRLAHCPLLVFAQGAVYLLRPLFLAGFLAYIIVPLQLRLRKYSHGLFARFALLVLVVLVLALLYLVLYRNIVDLSNSLPELSRRSGSRQGIQRFRQSPLARIDQGCRREREHNAPMGQQH